MTINDYGNFKDSKKAPVHRWFQYPAGYSYKFISAKITEYNLNSDSFILDPFVGCGTTCVEARKMGVPSIGIEAHPFVANIAKTKLNWDLDIGLLHTLLFEITSIGINNKNIMELSIENSKTMPSLIYKCLSESNLLQLLQIRNYIALSSYEQKYKDFFNLALITTLRTASTAGTGWPYIAPSKYHEKNGVKDSINEFSKIASIMINDLVEMKKITKNKDVQYQIIEGDSRVIHKEIPLGKIDLAITSPPYLNNYDYADRTRYETYFMGYASNWKDITTKVRDKLIVAATTQVKRTNFIPQKSLNEEIKNNSNSLYEELTEKIVQLSELRTEKRGKKSYDIMVSQYFNDLYPIVKNVFNYLKKDSDFVLVLGDSAPYGVHIPTERYIGDLGKGVGFSDYDIEIIRTRGDKWKNNPQRHNLKLQESILTLHK